MKDRQEDRPTFSFVSPVYNEDEGLDRFYRRLKDVADQLGEPYEIVFVNDGSEDGSEALLGRLAAADPRVRVVEFSRNFGHQAAVTAGYDHASGKAVISLDADCQHPPEMIPEMIRLWREGFEIVYTVRKDTHGLSRYRRWVGRMAYRLIRSASGMDLMDQADFRLLDRRAVLALRRTREQARLLRGLVRWVGFRQTAIPYEAEKRIAGRSTYTLKQLMAMTSAGVFNFSRKPLQMLGSLGATLVVGAMIWAIVWLALWAGGVVVGPWWHVTVAMAAMTGLQLLGLGIVGEYVGRVFEEAKGRPLYVVRRRLGFGEPGNVDEATKAPAPHAQKDGISFYT
jgi:polyisoprenyl-phosphate glycosyltransferase